MLGIDDSTMPNDGFSDPYIVASFIDNNRIFVSFYHNMTDTHFHLIYNISNRFSYKPIRFKIPLTSEENFPVDCFYNEGLQEAYVFYRQG